jgi:hypothetical protein
MADKLTVKFAKITGKERLPDRMLYSGYFETDDPKKLALGQIFYFIEIVVPWFPNTQIGHSIINSLTESFYDQSSLDTALNLENALRSVNGRLADIAGESEGDWLKNLNAVIGVVKNDEIIFSQVGNLSGYLFRDDKISQITESLSLRREVSPLKVFESLISGQIEAGDKVFFANTQLFNHISVDRVRINLGAEHIEDGLEKIFQHLKKIKGKEVNVLTFEANTESAFQNRALSNCPSVFYLDLPIESRLLQYRKMVEPHAKAVAKHSKKIYDLTKIGFRKSRIYLSHKVAPKVIIAAKRTSDVAAKSFGQANEKLMPKIKEFGSSKTASKVKTVTGTYFVSGASNSKKFFKFLQPFFGNFRFLLKPPYRQYIYGVIAVLILSLAFMKIHANNDKQVDLKKQQEVAAAYDKAKSAFETAKTDLGLKRTDKGQNELTSALALAKTAESSSLNSSEAQDLYNQIQAKIDGITQTIRISKSNIISPASGVTASIIYSDNLLYIFGDQGQISTTNVKTQEVKTLASLPKSSGTVLAATINTTGDTFYIYTSLRKVFRYKVGAAPEDLTISSGSGSWEEAVAIGEFAGNIYLLDPTSGEVWKHTPITGGYNKGKDYLDTSKVSIKGALDMTINGDIFVLQKDNSVKKFTKGVPDDSFSLKALPAASQPLKEPKKIVSDNVTGDLYIIDKTGNRVIHYSKGGEFLKQYAVDGGEIKNIAINPKTEKIWFLTTDKIYEASL